MTETKDQLRDQLRDTADLVEKNTDTPSSHEIRSVRKTIRQTGNDEPRPSSNPNLAEIHTPLNVTIGQIRSTSIDTPTGLKTPLSREQVDIIRRSNEDGSPEEKGLEAKIQRILMARSVLETLLQSEGDRQTLALLTMNQRTLKEELPTAKLEEAISMAIKKYPNQPLNLVDIGLLKSRAQYLRDHLIPNRKERVITYAMKANSDERVRQELMPYIDGFDCASENETIMAKMSGAKDDQIFRNFPKASIEDMILAIDQGCKYLTVEDPIKLNKILLHCTQILDHKKPEIAIRIAIDKANSQNGQNTELAMDTKFGIPSSESNRIVSMIKKVKDMGMQVGICFHPGSQISESSTYSHAIRQAADICKIAGGVNSFNAGGGLPLDYFPGIQDVPSIETFMETINSAINAHVNEEVLTGPDAKIIFELGRWLPGAAVTYISPITGIETRGGILNVSFKGGVHSTLNGIPLHGWPLPPLKVVDQEGIELTGELIKCRLSGQSCNPIDMIDSQLPNAITNQHYLTLANAGAYTDGYSSYGFNGFELPKNIAYNNLPQKQKSKEKESVKFLTARALTGPEIQPERIQSVTDFYRELFGNTMHYAACVDCDSKNIPNTRLTAMQVFGKYTRLDKMDKSEMPNCPCCQEQMKPVYDKEVLKDNFYQKLKQSKQSFLSTVHREDTNICGAGFAYVTNLGRELALEWGNSNQYMHPDHQKPEQNRSIENFLASVQTLFPDKKITAETEILAWNCMAINKEGHGALSLLMRELFNKMPEDVLELKVLGDVKKDSPAHQIFRTVGGRDGLGFFEEGSGDILIGGEVRNVRKIFNLDPRSFKALYIEKNAPYMKKK